MTQELLSDGNVNTYLGCLHPSGTKGLLVSIARAARDEGSMAAKDDGRVSTMDDGRVAAPQWLRWHFCDCPPWGLGVGGMVIRVACSVLGPTAQEKASRKCKCHLGKTKSTLNIK